jgi:hypothetical protein
MESRSPLIGDESIRELAMSAYLGATHATAAAFGQVSALMGETPRDNGIFLA